MPKDMSIKRVGTKNIALLSITDDVIINGYRLCWNDKALPKMMVGEVSPEDWMTFIAQPCDGIEGGLGADLVIYFISSDAKIYLNNNFSSSAIKGSLVKRLQEDHARLKNDRSFITIRRVNSRKSLLKTIKDWLAGLDKKRLRKERLLLPE